MSRKKKLKRGKLIVLEGLDGSGKKTQIDILERKLLQEGFAVSKIDFPAYHQTFFGKLVAAYLRGEFGGKDLDPYLTSLLYAGDRFELKDKISQWLQDGRVVLANRYILSNLAFQGAKIRRERARHKFLNFCRQLEYQVYKMPKENLIIFLDLPPEISRGLVWKKGVRKYLDLKKPKLDVHEKDLPFLQNVRTVYLNLGRNISHFVTVSCVEDEKLLSKEEISERVFKIVQKVVRQNSP